MTSSSEILAYAPFASSPLNPSSPPDSPQRKPRRCRTAKGTKTAAFLSPTQRLLRKKAAEAWMARRHTSIDVRLSTAGDFLDEGDLAAARLITISIDEARSLALLDKIIGSDRNGMELEKKSHFDVDLESLGAASPKSLSPAPAPWVLRLPDKVSTMAIRVLAAVMGTFCAHGFARVHNLLRETRIRISQGLVDDMLRAWKEPQGRFEV